MTAAQNALRQPLPPQAQNANHQLSPFPLPTREAPTRVREFGNADTPSGKIHQSSKLQEDCHPPRQGRQTRLWTSSPDSWEVLCLLCVRRLFHNQDPRLHLITLRRISW